jgi:hypothetical protein
MLCLVLRRKIFLRAYLIGEVLTTYVNQVRSLLIIRQVRSDALGHHHHKSAVIHVEPEGAADKFFVPIAHERTMVVSCAIDIWRRQNG